MVQMSLCGLPAPGIGSPFFPSRSPLLSFHRSLRFPRASSSFPSSSSANDAPVPSSSSSSPSSSSDPSLTAPAEGRKEKEAAQGGFSSWWQAQQEKSAALRRKLVELGPAAVLAYGLFDGVTYTIAFAIAFLGYEAKTGLNPTANVADIVKIVLLMWAGNNATRPFRLAGAAALAPTMERLMVWMQKRFNFPNKMFSFFFIVGFVAAVCLGIVGTLFLSRYMQG